jgi:23S rRNA (cytosine1962-C5)-methyltransferase
MSTVYHRCRLRLKKGEERSLLKGNPCVRKHQIEGVDGSYDAGCEAGVYDYRGHCLGAGFANMNTDVALRLIRFGAGPVDAALLRNRLAEAQAYRHRLFAPDEKSYRLVHAEGDWLPGLVADRYGPYLSLQFTTLGMEMRRDLLVKMLQERLQPEAIVLRNDLEEREAESLPRQVKVIHGELPRQVEITVDGLTLQSDLLSGSRTGFYLDQRENRRRAAAMCQDSLVLDACCHTGCFSVMAAQRGARQVVGLDSSSAALNLAEQNAERHNLSDKCSFVRDDIFVFLRKYAENGDEPFDLIFLDPPPLIVSKQTMDRDISTYRRLNRLALKCLKPGGVLVSSSRSALLPTRVFLEELGTAVRASKRRARLARYSGSSPDHPGLPAMIETRRLKCAFLATGGGSARPGKV